MATPAQYGHRRSCTCCTYWFLQNMGHFIAAYNVFRHYLTIATHHQIIFMIYCDLKMEGPPWIAAFKALSPLSMLPIDMRCCEASPQFLQSYPECCYWLWLLLKSPIARAAFNATLLAQQGVRIALDNAATAWQTQPKARWPWVRAVESEGDDRAASGNCIIHRLHWYWQQMDGRHCIPLGIANCLGRFLTEWSL